MSSNKYDIEWKRSAVKELKLLPGEVVTRVIRAVEGLRLDPIPPAFVNFPVCSARTA
jgi:mRNA-degrading endonuclease RelE of RelBE toxin-antitoxin system